MKKQLPERPPHAGNTKMDWSHWFTSPLLHLSTIFLGSLWEHTCLDNNSRPLPWRLCYHFLLHCPLRGLWLDYEWAVGWEPQAESRYVSSLGVIDFIHFIQVSRNDDTERIWLTTSKCKHFFLQGQEKHSLRFMSDLSLHEFRFASMCESSDHFAFAQMFCWPNLNLWVRIANRFHERLQLVVRKVPSLHSSFHWPFGVLEAENR